MIEIYITKLASKQVLKAPDFIQRKIATWRLDVERFGLDEVSKSPGYHDEPLKGKRKGQRSVRLNIKWRLIYSVDNNQKVTLLNIEEVTPHDY